MARVRLLLTVLVVLSGCASPVTITRLEPRDAYSRLNRSALSDDKPSETTLTVLRRHGLISSFGTWPDETVAALRGRVIGHPHAWPELFALAELSYLRGRQTGSMSDYLAAAIYAYAFLFPDDGRPADRPDAFDPRFRQASDLYNISLAAAMTPVAGGPAVFRPGRNALPFGAIDIAVDESSFSSGGRALTSFQPTAGLEVSGLQNQYRTPGIGAPMAASVAAPAAPARGIQVAPRLRIPSTVLLEIPNARHQLAGPLLHATLTIHTIFGEPTVRLGGDVVPLEFDQTAARAYSLVETQAWANEFRDFLFGDLFQLQKAPTLAALEPHRPGRMPVVLIHGTASSPFRWADMVNDLTEDERIRNNYEFWFFTYATGNPIPYSALLLRQALQDAVQQLGGVATDPALGRMVLIGHSQGGLLARMLTIDAGPRLWNAVSRRPLDALRLRAQTRDLIRNSFFVDHLPEVERVIFIATPHRGSYLTEFSPARLLSRFVSLPASLAKDAAEAMTGNADALKFDPSSVHVGSLYGMTPGNPWMQEMARLPVAPGIHAHSIIPTLGSGPLEERDDGVVRYQSAHLDGVDSELVVASSHSVQANPEAIEEVRRILLLQLAEQTPNRPVAVASPGSAVSAD
ncbi:MAG: alpha/beta fold hydrolase [Acetobacteraceae bacterium]|nr:alpha/beta fold hydrolase [Acetobacteraceae bacterium]